MEAHIALCNFSLKVSNLSIFIFLLSLYAITFAVLLRKAK